MSCDQCLNKKYPGKIITVDRDGNCLNCGEHIPGSVMKRFIPKPQSRWDNLFMTICDALATKSSCLSRQVGAVIVSDNSIISTGYNGPSRGYPHCGDKYVECPRHLKGYKSGEHLDECPAAHAETNCIANAARNGVSVLGGTLYLNTQIPCKDCMVLIVNAGIKEVVVSDLIPYHKISNPIAGYGNVSIREAKK